MLGACEHGSGGRNVVGWSRRQQRPLRYNSNVSSYNQRTVRRDVNRPLQTQSQLETDIIADGQMSNSDPFSVGYSSSDDESEASGKQHDSDDAGSEQPMEVNNPVRVSTDKSKRTNKPMIPRTMMNQAINPIGPKMIRNLRRDQRRRMMHFWIQLQRRHLLVRKRTTGCFLNLPKRLADSKLLWSRTVRFKLCLVNWHVNLSNSIRRNASGLRRSLPNNGRRN